MNVETPASEDLSHILGIISSLLSNLPSESPNRIRLLAKFVEEDYEKVDKLIELRDAARTRLNLTEAEVEADRQVFLFSQNMHDLVNFTLFKRQLWHPRATRDYLWMLKTLSTFDALTEAYSRSKQ